MISRDGLSRTGVEVILSAVVSFLIMFSLNSRSAIETG